MRENGQAAEVFLSVGARFIRNFLMIRRLNQNKIISGEIH